MNIVLIGYRCSGKTSVGKRLARKQGWLFVDTDDRLTEKAGRSVREIVADSGWEGFRRLERDVIQEVCGRNNTVIATGGGAVLDPANVAAMQKSGRVVWLKVSPQTVKERMLRDGNTVDQRPSLTVNNPYAEITEVLNSRIPSYEQAMDFSVDTEGRSILEVAEIIWAAVNESRKHEISGKSEKKTCRVLSAKY